MGGELALHHLHPRGAPLFRRFGVRMGGLPSPPLLLLITWGVFNPLLSFSLSLWWVFLLLLFLLIAPKTRQWP